MVLGSLGQEYTSIYYGSISNPISMCLEPNPNFSQIQTKAPCPLYSKIKTSYTQLIGCSFARLTTVIVASLRMV